MTKEIWKPIKGYEGLYEVSNTGKVKSLGGKRTKKYESILKQVKTNCYLQVTLCKDGKIKNCRVHRLVATAFLHNPENLPEVNHKDENKENNRVDNLEWCSRKYNNNYGTLRERMVKKLSKPVLQYTKTGEFIREWSSTHEVGKNGFRQGNIVNCCNGKLKTAYGFIWKYK